MINKYWKLIALMTVIVLGIGTFYVYKHVESSTLPDLVLQKESGDASEGEKVTIQGDYTDGEYISHPGDYTDGEYTSLHMDITSKGSTYGIDASYFEGYLDPYSDSDMMRSLQKEHRNFMRKKNNETSFYEDDDLIAYADVDIDYLNHEGKEDFTFDVAILNKADNKQETFTVDVPNNENLDFVYVEDVQVNDGELYIVTDNQIFKENIQGTEIHVYQFDLSSKNLIQDEIIVHVPDKKNISVYAGLLPEVNRKGSHDYAIFSHTESKEDGGEDGNPDAESLKAELIAYDFSTDETKTLELPDEVSDLENMYQVFDGSVIYFVDDSDDEVMVSIYDVETEQVEREVTVDVPASKSEYVKKHVDRYSGSIVKIKHDKIYILTNPSIDAHVLVVDLESGDVLYDGVFDVENNAEFDGYELWLNDLEIG